MKQFTPLILVFMMLLLNGCAVVGGIFKAGVWVGVLLVLFIIGIIIWLSWVGQLPPLVLIALS